MRNFIKIILFALLFSCLSDSVQAFYPLNNKYFKLSNFGEYRTATYIHDGIDLACQGGTPVFSVKDGVVDAIYKDAKGYGENIIVRHYDNSTTRYCHLSRIDVKKDDFVNAGQRIGLSGATGNVKGPHLHFGYYIEDGGNLYAVDPVTHGLDQPNNGDAYLYDGPMYKAGASNGEYTNGIYFLTKDSAGNYTRRWYGLVPFWTAGETVRIVIEAYDKMNETPNTTTSPYRIDVKITDSSGRVVKDGDGHDSVYSINFGEKRLTTEANTYSPLHTGIKNTIFNFSSPLCTEGFDYANGRLYFYYNWKPPSGWIYKINVDVYDSYRDNNGDDKTTTGTLSTPITCSKSMYFTCGLGSTHSAAVGGTHEAAITSLYAEVEPNRFSPNSTNPNLPNKAEILAEVGTGEVDWAVKILDNGKDIIKTLNGSKGRTLDIFWDGTNQSGFKVSSGTYSYIVEAKQGTAAATYEGGEIIIDDQPPTLTSLAVSPLVNIISSTESTGITIAANKDLYSVKVTLLDKIDNEVAFIGYIPGIFANESKQINWYWAGQAPNGEYKFKVTATDMAGNEKTETSSSVIVNVPGNTAPTLEPIPQEDKKAEKLPDLPSWEARPIISDLAFDSSGNQYVLYGRYNKLVKYDSSGNIIKTLTGVGTSEFRLPLGLAVSLSGDRVYLADTYSNRIGIFDENLNFLNSVDAGVLKSLRKLKVTEHWFGGWVKTGSNISDPEKGSSQISGSLYKPTDIRIGSDGEVYVVDSFNHRILRFSRDGVTLAPGEVFGGVVFDKTAEAREYYKISGSWMLTSHADYCYFWSNALNDSLEWINNWYAFYAFQEIAMPQHLNYGTANGQFASPESIAIDSTGNIFVADTGNNRIQKFNPDGSFAAKFGEGILNSPKGIDIDSYGSVWVADTGNQRIVQFNAIGEFVKEYKSEDYAINPQKIKVKDGKIYMADANFNKPLVWNVGGELANVRTSSPWFSPSGNSTKGPLKIFYNLTQPADVTVQLIPKTEAGITALGASGGTVLDKTAKSVGMNQEVWDGKLLSATAMSAPSTPEAAIPNGQYMLKIAAAFGDYVKTKTVDINIDNTKPSVALNRAPPAISPNADSVKDSLNIDYSIADNLSPTSEVKLSLRKNGRILDVLLDRPKTTDQRPKTESLVWNGKIGSYVIEGNYILELKATDLAGNTTTATAEVLVDFQAPRIEAVNVSNPYFSPNGDGRKDNTEISFYLNDNFAGRMPVTILVEDKNGAEAATVARRTELTPGEHSFTWEGSGLPDGDYKIRIYAEDEAGNLGTSDPQAVAIDIVLPTIESFAASPNPFNPNNDGVKDRTLFTYSLSEPCFTELKIFRGDGAALFRDYRQYDIENGSFRWDGSGFHGEIMGEEHPYHLYAEDRAGNITTSENEIIVVDYAPSLVPYAFAEPDPFSPVNSRNSFTDIEYYLSRDGLTVNVVVVGKEGRVVKQLVNNKVQNKGEHSVRWNGDFDSSYDGPRASGDQDKVADGSWEFKVTAAASDEPNPCLTSNTVLVDNVPPYIMAEPIDVDLVSRNATLRYSIPETASVEVAVYDSGNSLIAELENSTRSAGIYASTWNPAAAVSDLTYFKVSAVDNALNETERRTELFSVVPQEALQITGLNARPGTFTPNGDGLIDITRISYQILGGAPEYRVSINIQTQTGSTIKSLVINDPQGSGIYSFYWDGTADGGRLAADGYYDYVIRAEDRLGSRVEGRGSILMISTRPTVDLSSGLPVFSPNDDGSKDTVTFNYSINYPTFYISGEALVKIEVINASSEAVWSRTFNHTAGSYVYEYNGLTADGSRLPAGNYFVRISAEDALGSTAIPKTVNLTVDYAEPLLTIQSIAPNPFSPYVNGVKDQTVISYTLAKSAYVSIKVKQGGSVIKTLQSDQWTEAYIPTSGLSASKVKAFGIPTVTWDGRNEDGSFAADRNHIIEISAIDSAGNSYQTSQTVEVDNTSPAVPAVDSMPANTNQGLQTITGSAELGSLVKVYINDNPASSGNASGSGSFSIPTTLVVGANNLKLTATDVAGNTSDYSAVQVVNYETDAPIISNLQVSPNPAKAGTLTITFEVSETLEADPIVRVNTETVTLGRRFPSSTDLNYEYFYNVTSSNQQGPAIISIEAKDLANNLTTYQANNLLTIDTVNTTISNVDIDVEGNPRGTSSTAYAKLGSKVTVDFSVSEVLLNDPIVLVGGQTATKESKTIYSPSRIDYSYSYYVTDTDPDGTTPVSIEVTDQANNQTTYQDSNLIIDKTSPEVSNLSYSANPAKAGELAIGFNVSEPLKSAPTVQITQYGANPSQIYGSQLTANSYEYKYDVVTGHDGPALITIEVTDLANNPTTYQSIEPMIIDTIAPVFTGINCEVTNPVFGGFTKQAKDGSEITITFQVSESLPFNPDVKVNGRPAAYDSLFSNEYSYRYTLRASEVDMDRENNRLAEISISGTDAAGNEGVVSTSSEAESFTVDLTKPTVAITENRDMIAEPSPFSTNASSEAGHRQTRLRYEISEYGLVTVSIHKVPNTQEVYTRSDFNDDNLIASYSEGWLGAGEHYKYWNGAIQFNQTSFDKNSNGFADPGKYAFIVEVKDRAGNVIEGKWGGTCWIQDNVLVLEQPDRTEIGGDNPRPRYFSPNGDGSLDSTTIWFRVKLGVTPAEAPRPERIGIMAIPSDFAWVGGRKLIGKYTVRVWNESKTALIRTITKEANLDSNIVLYETWDGRYGTGPDKLTPGDYVPEGNYKVEIDARDFIGGQAENNLLTLTVTVDKNAPRVVDNESGTVDTTPWRNSPISYNVDFHDDHNAYASKLKHAQYKVTTGPNQSGAVKINWRDVFSDGLNAASYTTDWGSEIFNHSPEITDGIYYISVKVQDYAGNETTQNDVFYVKKDTGLPSASAPSTSTPTNNQRPTWSWSASSDMSGIQGYYVKLENSSGGTIVGETWVGNTTSWTTTTDLSDGTYYAYVKVMDGANNIGNYGDIGSVMVDTVSPEISISRIIFNQFNPYKDENARVEFSVIDPTPSSGLPFTNISAKIIHTLFTTQEIKTLNIREIDGNYYIEWNGMNDNDDYVNEGGYTLLISAKDNTGNSATNICTLTLIDDQRITDNSADSNSPYLTISGSTLNLKWVEGSQNVNASISASDSYDLTTGVEPIDGSWGGWEYFTLDYAQNVSFQASGYWTKWQIDETVYSYSSSNASKTIYLNSGVHKARVAAGLVSGIGPASGTARLTASYLDFKYNQFEQYSTNSGKDWNWGGSWPGATRVDDLPNPARSTEQTATFDGRIIHKIRIFTGWMGNYLEYLRSEDGGSSWSSAARINQLTGKCSSRSGTMYPTIACDSSNNAYVAWTDFRNDSSSPPSNYEIYFQKIPYKFAPVRGTPTGFVFTFNANKNQVITQSATPELPTLLSPADGAALETRRPTFEWKAPKTAYKDYKVLWAKGGRFDSLDLNDKGESPLRQENVHGTTKSDDPTHVYFGYTIPYIDPALEQLTPSSPVDYSWKVTAVTSLGGTAVTSEVRTFRCEPDLEMTGVTNWPNPFNPNREETNIRYKLSRDADEVKIRIYDITGALVVDLDGDTGGEGTSMLTKYHDVRWNGRNGRGDMVMNGIYPFEIVARSGDKSVSGRGKIAVLK